VPGPVEEAVLGRRRDLQRFRLLPQRQPRGREEGWRFIIVIVIVLIGRLVVLDAGTGARGRRGGRIGVER
jgi:hypothetical protein